MLYPRETIKGELVTDQQMVGTREHLTQKYRCLFLTGVLTGETESHNLLIALDTLSHDPIKLFITSPGGDLDSTFLFYDTMKLVKSPVITIGRYCASAAALILAAGKKRYLFPHAKVMLHLPFGQMEGDTKDFEIQGQEMKKYKDRMVDILLECGVKRTRVQILKDMSVKRTMWMEPNEAIEYGLADAVATPTLMKEWFK